MKKYILVMLFAGLCLTGSSVCASNSDYVQHLELLQQVIDEASDESCQNTMRLALVESNINYLESCARSKAKHLEARLIACQNKLGKSECEKKIEALLKKVAKLENKLSEINEVIQGIELLKARIAE